MRTILLTTVAGVVLTSCGGTAGVTQIIVPPAGWADGTKTTDTSGLEFRSTSSGAAVLTNGTGAISDVTFAIRKTSNPDQVIAIVGGEEIVLQYDMYAEQFYGRSSKTLVSVSEAIQSSSKQVELAAFLYSNNYGTNGATGFIAFGLETDPTEVTAKTGSATFNGQSIILVAHGDPSAADFGGGGTGTATLTADFAASTISGSMTMDTVDGDPGYQVMPTTIGINESAITANGFASTLSINAADLAMSSVANSTITGKFYGVDASDVAGTFSGSGTSIDGSRETFFVGGFLGE